MRPRRLVFTVFLCGICAASRLGAQSLPPDLDFNRHVVPILADNCYPCHGPDPGGRKASLRLDRADGAQARLKDGKQAIVPGSPDQSELIRRVTSADPDVHMPPEGHDALKPGQIEILRKWILQGAKYRSHWSFEKPIRPPLPAAKQPGWAKNPIDLFVLANLEAHGLVPSTPATKQALIRRVTLDLTGLLPTPAEVAAFAADDSPNAYDELVDRLLASPRYGEHRARYWLDYARYGDTHGLHNDNFRDIWPYRDYVIRAFNANKPYDQFAVEQLAGDLLPPTSLDQLLATGFVRCNLSTGEGGTINEEINVGNNRDRVEAYGTVFLGLTLGCAVCHDHKFDPVTQRDFYSLTAYFNNLAERASNDDRFDPPPTIRMPKPEKLAEYNAALAERAAVERRLNARESHVDTLVRDWIDFDPAPLQVSTKALDLRFRFDEGSGDAAINGAPAAHPARVPFGGTPPVWGEETWLWPAIRFEAATKLEIPGAGDFEKDQPFSAGGWVEVRFNPTAIGDVNAGALMARLDAANGSRGWDLWYENGALVVDLIGDTAKSLIKVQTTTTIPKGEWRHAFFTYDGSAKAAGVRIYVDGKSQPVKIVADALAGSIRTKAPWELGRRHDAAAMKLARYQDVRVYSRQLGAAEVARLPFEDYVAEIVARPHNAWSDDQRHVVNQFYLDQVDEPARQYARQIRALDQKLDAIAKGGELAMICRERPQLPAAHILTRGVYTARAGQVRPGVPAFLPRLPAGLRQDRLALARWTVSADNPLTARVAVNRMWQEVFGVGLVETPGDFGLMGARPANPDLLDWLAVEFRDGGSDVKHIYRLLVTSATYRQSARATPEMIDRDPQNRLLARGPRFRMDGEMLRDCALEAAGLLVQKIGGPSAKPYQPPGIFEAVRGLATKPQIWEQDHGDGVYRRSLYTFWKRQSPPPNMITLDAPPRDVSCPRRERTNTPLQALVLLNDPQWVEAARLLADRAITHGGKADEQKLTFIARSILSRDLTPGEATIFLESLRTFRARYESDPAAAKEFLDVGDAKTKPSPELASWTLVASEILNTDEALNK